MNLEKNHVDYHRPRVKNGVFPHLNIYADKIFEFETLKREK